MKPPVVATFLAMGINLSDFADSNQGLDLNQRPLGYEGNPGPRFRNLTHGERTR
jgi:hypothetical protein